MSNYTKRLSLQELIASGARARSHRSILSALNRVGVPMTDRAIEAASGVSRSGVCGRMKELLAIGYVREAEPVRCHVSRKLVRTTRLTPQGLMAVIEAQRNEDKLNAQRGVLVA